MTRLLLTSALFFSASLIGFAQEVETPPKPKTAAETMQPGQVRFSSLPKAQRQLYGKRIQEGLKLFQEKRVFECLETLSDAEEIFDELPDLYNLRASCYVEFRDFPKALANYEKANSLAPGDPYIQFNVAELNFVQKKYEVAIELFEKTIKLLPKNEKGLRHISEFKVLLSLIGLERINEAKILSKKYSYMDDTPFYYFAKAAMAFQADDPDKAQEEMLRAVRVFRRPQFIENYQDALIEFGFIKSFYGEDNPELEE